MRICLVGDFGEPRDIGERSLAYNLANSLGQRNLVMRLNPKSILSPKLMTKLFKFHSQIIHYLTGPRGRSFIILSILKEISRCRVAVMSAPRPVISDKHLLFLKFIKPDAVLSQSTVHTQIFMKHGFNVQFFPNGVDTIKFRPVKEDQKNALREKYGIPKDQCVVLHIGYIARRRGIELLVRLAEDLGLFIVLVAATSWIAPDAGLLDRLKAAGCKVILEYLSNIEEIYQLSDLFVFPGSGREDEDISQFEGRNRSPSIEIPLSVLEALACNLPVVSRKFGGLQDMFPPDSGIFFADSDEQILNTIKNLINFTVQLNSRRLVMDYKWENLVGRLEQLYANLLETH